MVMKDFLFECSREMSTGSAGVDHLNMVRLSMQPEFFALVDYLVDKGILNEEEFSKYLGKHFKAQIEVAERSAQKKVAQ